MEIQHVVSVPTWTKCLWQRIPDFELPFEKIVSLVCQCIFWVVIFYCYRRLELFFQNRRRGTRQKEHLHEYQSHSDTERYFIEQLYPDVQTSGGITAEAQLVDPTQVPTGRGAAQELLDLQVPVSIYVAASNNVDSVAAIGSLKNEASRLRALGQEVNLLQASTGPVVQTKLRPFASDTANKLQQIIAKTKNRFVVQLGRWRVFLPISGGVEEAKMLKLDDICTVPMILHSSYSGGVLTVEGLHLKQATIQAATKDKCITLETNYAAGSEGLEVFTSESGLPSNNLADVFVLASKKIEVEGHELRVNSLAVPIQNDTLRTVLWTILPFTSLFIYATNNIVLNVMEIMDTTNTASVVAWLWTFLCMFIVSTRALPQRTETAITVSLKKLTMRLYLTLYFAVQCFNLVKDPDISSLNEAVSIMSEDGSTLEDEESSEPLIETDINIGVSVSKPDWEWPIFDTVYENFYWDSNLVKREQSKTDIKGPFEVIYRNVKGMPWASQVQVNIFSPFLIGIIKDLMPNSVDRWAICKKMLLDGPELFFIYDKMKELQDSFLAEQESLKVSSSKTSSSEASSSLCEDSTNKNENILHLNHLLRFMDKEFEDMKPMYAAMKSEAKVSWEMLWAFFPSQTRVAYADPLTDEILCAEILQTNYAEIRTPKQNLLVLLVNVSVWDYNGSTWKKCSKEIVLPKFDGECHISSLSIYPLQFKKDPDKTNETIFLEKGKKFCEFSMMARNCFINYKGSMNIWNEYTNCIVKENADGRAMVDLGSFARLNPSFPMGNAKPPCEVTRNKATETIDITEDETRMFAPAIVYGFSFRIKKWGSLSVCGCAPIDFNTSAFDDLVMDETTKDVVENLVRKQLADGKDKEMQESDRVDPIASKGEGCILLCYGPPGTGKTMTAESLSEKLMCPLWALSVSELGLTPESLEDTLMQVMDVAASWGAILLLDEADVFLERRTSTDLTRNAMTGVFLRQLEYYTGVLFLTTNRDSAFDDAIRSRISMFLHYGRHNKEQRRKIWTSLCDRIGLKDIPSEVLEEFAKPDFNGREIRNIVKTAHTLSRSIDDSAKLEVSHVKTAFTVYEKSSKFWACKNPAPQNAPENAFT